MAFTLSKKTADDLQRLIKDSKALTRPAKVHPERHVLQPYRCAIVADEYLGGSVYLGYPSLFVAENLSWEDLEDVVFRVSPNGPLTIGKRYDATRYGDFDETATFVTLISCCSESSSSSPSGICTECEPIDSFCFTVSGNLSNCNPFCDGNVFEGEWQVNRGDHTTLPGLCGYWYSDNRQCSDGSNWNAQLLYWHSGLVTLMFTQPTGMPGAGIGQVTTYWVQQSWDCASEITLPVRSQGLCSGWDENITVYPGDCGAGDGLICDCGELPETLYCNISPDLCSEYADQTFALTQSGTLWTGTALLGHCDDYGETYVTVSFECDGNQPVSLHVTFDSQASIAGTEYFCPSDETEHEYSPEPGGSCDPLDVTFVSDPMDFSAGHCCCESNLVTFTFHITE